MLVRSKIFLCLYSAVAWLLVAPFAAGAFKGTVEAHPDALLEPVENRRIIILDNDYLDRRFGKNREPETDVASNATSLPIERSVYTFHGPVIVDVPARRSVDVSPNGSLLKGIDRKTPPRRAAALRLAETGRTLLESGQNRKAIFYLEKALGMDASPFLYYYLARAHFQLADYQSARRFLTVAERGFSNSPEWWPEVIALKEALLKFPWQQTPPARNVNWTFNE